MNLSEKIARLPKKERRGSRPRCLVLTEGAPREVAGRLNELLHPFATIDPGFATWMPRGFGHPAEAELTKQGTFLTSVQKEAVSSWWLARRRGARTPTWDFASPALIEGREGLVLIEAKAHENELDPLGKRKDEKSSPENHKKIGEAIAQASQALSALSLGWNLSRDHHYQLANRFAWGWKLASLGIPVVLVYLGFLEAREMEAQGLPFRDEAHWRETVLQYSRESIPAEVWGKPLKVGGIPLVAMIRSTRVDLA
jgi:hypothetical protein